jgi:hypothetical protein
VDRRAVYDPSASDPERGRGQDTALDQAP